MKKDKRYQFIRFPVEMLREASKALRNEVDPGDKVDSSYRLRVEVDDAEWTHDSLEEFFADYRRSAGEATFTEYIGRQNELYVNVIGRNPITIVQVEAENRSQIETVFGVFEKYIASHPPEKRPHVKPKVFIGHGQSLAWRDLKDHLQDKHGYDIVAYEIGARAGHQIRDVLEQMLSESRFATLVMTRDDEVNPDEFRARQNVIHELGLFQGRLGFTRAIMLVEEETQEFSNIHGVQQIRFSKENIKETFGEVLATLRREFPESAG